MKKEWVEKDHCPYCKRHCSLQNPHCGKGKTLAEEIKKENKKKEDKRKEVKGKGDKNKADKSKKDKREVVKSKEDKSKEEIKKADISNEKVLEPVAAFTDSEIEKLNRMRSDLHLFLLYLKGSESLSNKMGGKSSEKGIRHYLLNLLADKGEVTPKELKDVTNLDALGLKKALKRLEEKEEIRIHQTKIQGRMITLTEKGKKEVREQIGEGTKAGESLFSVLNEEEKKSLENILLKLMN